MIGDLLEDQGRRTAAQIAETCATTGFDPLDVTDDGSWAGTVAAWPNSTGSIC